MFNTPEWAYTSLIAKEFNTTEKSFGVISSSLEYTFYQFEQQRNNFVEGDIVIIALSLLDKTFFFNDRPELSQMWSFETEEHTVEEKTAMEMYYNHLHNSKNIKINLINFLHSVQEVTQRKRLKTVILKTLFFDTDNIVNKERYPELIIANDCFWELMKVEISQESLLSYLNLHKFTNDARTFHFMEPNHKIIADSIISAIKYNTEINLENVLLRNIYNWDLYNQSRP
jgi:hypothetical protein